MDYNNKQKNNDRYGNDNAGMELEITCRIPAHVREIFIDEMEQLFPLFAEAKGKELLEEYDPICMVLLPNGATVLLTVSEAEEYYGNMGSDFFVYGDRISLYCKAEDVVMLGGRSYLTGAAMIYEADEDGEMCSIDGVTVSLTMEFFEENVTTIQVDGVVYPALRLV